MSYNQFLPGPALAPYIDAYWTVTDKKKAPAAEKIMPDGCVNIILNLGEDIHTDHPSRGGTPGGHPFQTGSVSILLS
jgi:hypothetical protein